MIPYCFRICYGKKKRKTVFSGRNIYVANFTYKAIKSSFIKLLSERPLSQIRVKDIVEDCGVNRNTFYYYFHDIPSLIEDMVMTEAEHIIQKYPSSDTIEEFFETTINYILARKTLFLHIYHSVNRELFEQYLWQVCERIVILYVDSVLDGRQITDGDRHVIVHYLKAVGFGIVSAWMQSGLTDDIRRSFERIYELKKGTVEEMIHRFEIR